MTLVIMIYYGPITEIFRDLLLNSLIEHKVFL